MVSKRWGSLVLNLKMECRKNDWFSLCQFWPENYNSGLGKIDQAVTSIRIFKIIEILLYIFPPPRCLSSLLSQRPPASQSIQFFTTISRHSPAVAHAALYCIAS